MAAVVAVDEVSHRLISPINLILHVASARTRARLAHEHAFEQFALAFILLPDHLPVVPCTQQLVSIRLSPGLLKLSGGELADIHRQDITH